MAVKDALGQFTRYAYDMKGQKIAEFGDNTYPLRFEYNDFGEMTKHYTYRSPNAVITEEPGTNGDMTAYAYDSASGLLKTKTFADGNKTTYTYDTNGNLSTRIWARGVITRYTYDPFGQLLSTTYSDNTPSITNTYDGLGRLKTVQDVKGTTTFAYNQYGQKTSETISGIYNKVLTTQYDSFGRNTGYGIDNVNQAVYTYDGTNGRLIGMNANGANFGFGYMENSHLQNTLTYPNGMVKTTAYEPNRDLISSIENKNGSTQVSKYAYENDILGRRVELNSTYENNTKNFDYGYNARSEVTSANQSGNADYQYGFNYDNIGNRVSANENGSNKNYTTNNLNQYTSNTDFTPTYDKDGNQTKIKTSTGEWEVTYNGENRPVEFRKGSRSIRMSYDYMGRRIEKVIRDSQMRDYGFNYTYTYKDYTLVEEYSVSLPPYRLERNYSYIWDPTAGMATKPLMIKEGGNTYYYTHDGNKNVTELVNSTGENVSHYEYTPFGAVSTEINTASVLNPFKFSSEYHDAELDLIYYNYRHYNTMDGKWISRDPLGENASLNLYMAKHNILNGFDLLGLSVSGNGGGVAFPWPWEFADILIDNHGQIDNLFPSAREWAETQIELIPPDEFVVTVVFYNMSFYYPCMCATLEASYQIANITFSPKYGKNEKIMKILWTIAQRTAISVSYQVIMNKTMSCLSGVKTTVSYWGPPSQVGKQQWVMVGDRNTSNYILSGKWQPGMTNTFAGPFSGGKMEVLKTDLANPTGWDAWKRLIGQQIYCPKK